MSLLDEAANYVIKNGTNPSVALQNGSNITGDKELLEQVIALKDKEVIAKEEIISTQKDYILHLKVELEKLKRKN